MPKKISRIGVLDAITEAYENDDLGFIEAVNNLTWGYKVRLKKKLSEELKKNF